MQHDRIVFNYQREDDILYIAFGEEGRNGMGFNLYPNILLRFDRETGEPFGLTFIDYSQLKALPAIPLADLSKLPENLAKIVRQILLSEPVSRFIAVNPRDFASFSVINPSMEKVIAA